MTDDKLPMAIARRMVTGENRLVVLDCPYCHGSHNHGDGTKDGSGEISGSRLADCGKGQYELTEENNEKA